jgi:hypothetical protein
MESVQADEPTPREIADAHAAAVARVWSAVDQGDECDAEHYIIEFIGETSQDPFLLALIARLDERLNEA